MSGTNLKNNNLNLTSQQRFRNSRYPDRQVLSDTAITADADLRGEWLPAFIVSLYYLTIWAPPFIPTLASRWFVALSLGFFAYIVQKTPINTKAANLVWVMFGLSLLGAVASLVRAPSLDLALWNTVALGMNFLTLLLFLPIMATRLTRGVLLIVLVGMAILWTFVIQQLVMKHGILAYSTFAETGDNKNAVGYSLALAATALFYLAIFWKPARVMGLGRVVITRFAFGLAGFYLFYYQVLIYARGSLFATIAGAGAVLVVMFLKSSQKPLALFQIGFVLFFAAIFAFVALPKVLEVSPYWNTMYLRAIIEGAGSIVSGRDILLRKGIYLITQNPILGVGLGGSRAAISSTDYAFPVSLIHNTFLTNWAEKGIFGLLSDVVWIFAYIKILRRKFFDLHIIDQIWLVVLTPFTVQMMFKNMSTEVMLLFLAGIYYEQYFIEKAKIVSSRKI